MLWDLNTFQDTTSKHGHIYMFCNKVFGKSIKKCELYHLLCCFPVYVDRPGTLHKSIVPSSVV